MKRPSFQFYPADWRKDSALQSCSIAARGLWVELICIMHECEEYGVLAVNGRAMTTAQIGRLVGETERSISKLLQELEDAGVYSRDDRGALFSRRMIADERIRTLRSEAGRLGGNPTLLNQKDNCLVKQKDNHESNQSPNQALTPSSSSSSTTSKSKTKNIAIVADDDVFPLADRGVVRDWIAIRKAKRLPVTRTVLDGMTAEAGKAGISETEMLRICCSRGWAGFSNKWDWQELGTRSGHGQQSRFDALAQSASELTGAARGSARTFEGTAIQVD